MDVYYGHCNKVFEIVALRYFGWVKGDSVVLPVNQAAIKRVFLGYWVLRFRL